MHKNAASGQENLQCTDATVLFDGVCNLCDGLVQFIIRHDPQARLRLAALQSAAGRGFLQRCGRPSDDFDTMVFLEAGRAYFKSTAALRVARYLQWPWPVLSLGLVVPPFVRDWCYDRVSQNRYRIFGKKETCMVPTPDVQLRFLTQPCKKA
jgi:predicted DCC family thiol-disulfide oxidoreductase YuxK